MPPDPTERASVQKSFEKIIVQEGQTVIGWRDIPTDNSLGLTAQKSEPFMMQVFIGRNPALTDDLAFERKLYIIRKVAEQRIRYSPFMMGGKWFYVSSLSARTAVYKGMLMPEQVANISLTCAMPDGLGAGAGASAFSTNTFPSWDRSHPHAVHRAQRRNQHAARQCELDERGAIQFRFGEIRQRHQKLIPVINTDGSDSAMFDNCVELLTLSGRDLPHAMMMMIPEPRENHESMDPERKAFYEFPPASWSRGWRQQSRSRMVSASAPCPDRNGLRPALLRHQGRHGHHGVGSGRVAHRAGAGFVKGRLQPGRMFLVDTLEGRIVADEELKKKYASAHPYQKWLDEHHVLLKDRPSRPKARRSSIAKFLQRQQAFGYTFEDLRFIVGPSARDGVQPLGSMGTDTPLAVLSQKPQLLHNYFKQLFAQSRTRRLIRSVKRS